MNQQKYLLDDVVITNSEGQRVTFKPIGGRYIGTSDPQGQTVAGYGLRTLADIIGDRVWEVYSIPITSTEDLPMLEEIFKRAVFTNVRQGKGKKANAKLHAILIQDDNVWGDFLIKEEIKVRNVSKVSKRFAAITAARALEAHGKGGLVIKEIPVDSFNKFLTPEQAEVVMDGPGIIRQSRVETMLDQWEESVRDSGYSTYKLDRMARRYEQAVMYNTRVLTEKGTLKGNFNGMYDDLMDSLGFAGVDIVVPEGSFKDGLIMGAGKWHITLEPQLWHDVVHTNIQSLVNLRALFTDRHLVEVVKDNLDKLRAKVKNGDVLVSEATLINQEVNALKEGNLADMVDLQSFWAAAEWKARGLDLRNSPSLLKSTADAMVRKIIKTDENRVPKDFRVEVPCAWYIQVVSLSTARMFGFKGKVRDGQMAHWESRHLIILSDLDYIAHYDRFGGSDMDDFFQVFFRTINGVKKAIIMRSPNGWGEYGVFDIREGDEFPTWTKADGTKVQFPEVKGSLPKQIDLAFADGDTLKVELENDVTAKHNGEFITRDEAWRRIEDAANTTVSAGLLVNAVGLWYMTMQRHLPITLGTLEDFIDLTTQEDLTREAAARLKFMAYFIVNLVVQSGKPIDITFWETRNFENMVVPTSVWEENMFNSWVSDVSKWEADDALNIMAQLWAKHDEDNPDINLVSEGKDAFFTIRLNHIVEQAEKFKDFVAEVGRKAQHPKEAVDLGELFVGVYGGTDGRTQATGMSEILRAARRRLGQISSELNSGQIKQAQADAAFERTFQLLYNTIVSKGGVMYSQQDQYDRVLGLALSCFRYRVGHLRCQYKGCSDGMTGAPKYGSDFVTFHGEKHWRCAEHGRMMDKDPSLKANLVPKRYNDNLVTNRFVFPLYIKALEFYGLANELGGVDDVTQGWVVQCKVDKEEATILNPLHLQAFLRRGSVCRKHANNS